MGVIQKVLLSGYAFGGVRVHVKMEKLADFKVIHPFHPVIIHFLIQGRYVLRIFQKVVINE